jgi:transposase
MHDRHDLSDEQWARIEGLFPDRTPKRGGRWMDHRLVVNGVLWRTRAGAAWRDLPASYGNWKTVYARHRRWAGDGTWRNVIDDLRADCDADDGVGEWGVGVDGTVIRAHQHAAGARREPPRDIPADVLAPTVMEETIRPGKDTGGSVELQESAWAS